MNQILHGDCLDVLKTLPDNSVDSVVTDPPYGLTSARPSGRSEATRGAVMGGFMGLKWDHGVPDKAVWAECLRVLKPGGHLLSFGGARTYHRLAVGIEDGGFEIRDQIMWLFGSGFPKSHNGPWGGTALKPAHEPICVARKPLVGTVAANVLAFGTGGLNIDACRVTTADKLGGGDQSAGTKSKPDGWNRPWMQDEAAKLSHSVRVNANVEKAEALGRWPANLIHDGSDEVLAAFPDAKGQLADASGTAPSAKTSGIYGAMKRVGEPSSGSANEGDVGFKMKPGARRLDGGSASRFFYCAKTSKKDRNEGCEGLPLKPSGMVSNTSGQHITRRDGGAPGPTANNHPTVKPTDLMRYLCRLVTPAGGTVLDPFMGSGSTGKAAALEGFSFIGIEKEEPYLAIAKARIAAVA